MVPISFARTLSIKIVPCKNTPCQLLSARDHSAYIHNPTGYTSIAYHLLIPTSEQNHTIPSTMAAAALREKQAPIKDGYRSNPSSALVTLTSSGSLDATSITCKLSTGKAVKEAQQKIAGLHPAAGGDDQTISGELCSGDMLLEALVACAGVTLKAVATALSIPLKSGSVFAEGDLDFRGTLGVDRDAPVGFQAIRLGFEIEIDGSTEEGKAVDEAKLEKLGRLTERYCVVLQTIAKKPSLSVSVRGRQESGEDGIDREMVWGQKS